MQFDSIAFIAAAEIAAVLLIFCIVLAFQNRSLRRIIKTLKARMTQLTSELKTAKAAPAPSPESGPAKTETATKNYSDLIEEQLENTRSHHATLEPNQDIVLDLAPDTELPRRAAALRYAVLLAEKEAYKSAQNQGETLNWRLLQAKYNQIFSFYEDYVLDQQSEDDHDAEALNQELLNAKKRLSNLEKFKTLYFELEEKWQSSTKTAQAHYEDLSAMASQVEDSEKFTTALESYYAAYNEVGKLISSGVETGEQDLLDSSNKRMT